MSRLRRGLLFVGSAVGVLGVATALRASAGPLVLQNITPSLPLGLYVRTVERLRVGAIVAVRQPEPARGYLRSLGYPQDALLLKRVAAEVGDEACRRKEHVLVHGRVVIVRDRDSKGEALPAWRECRRLERGELFLLGHASGSFDSRYFGPVQRTEVIGVYRQVGW